MVSLLKRTEDSDLIDASLVALNSRRMSVLILCEGRSYLTLDSCSLPRNGLCPVLGPLIIRGRGNSLNTKS